MNDHFKVGHYKSPEREKEDEKNVEESEETDEEKEHTEDLLSPIAPKLYSYGLALIGYKYNSK